MRDNDLRSVNFFDVDRHPDMTFESTGLTVHRGLLELPGKLTIRSITRDVAVEVELLIGHGLSPCSLTHRCTLHFGQLHH